MYGHDVQSRFARRGLPIQVVVDKVQLNPASSRETLHRSDGLTKEQLVVSISPRLTRGFSEPFRLSDCSTFSSFNSTPLGNEDGLEIVARDRRLRRHPSIAPRYSARTTLRLLMLLQTALTFFNPTPLKRGPQRNHKSLRHLLGVLSIPPRPKRRPQL